MNRENIQKLIWHMEQVPKETFFMGLWFASKPDGDVLPTIHEMRCGTVACVAGHAVMLLGTEQDRATCGVEIEAIPIVAAGLLGLNDRQATKLFHGPWRTPAEAACALRGMLLAG